MSRRVLWFVAVAGFVALAAVVAVLLIQERDGPEIEVADCAAIEAASPIAPENDSSGDGAPSDEQQRAAGMDDGRGSPAAVDDSVPGREAEGTDEIPADETTADQHGTDERPLTIRDRPDWDKVKTLPIGEPREPATPEYASSLDESDWQVYDTTPETEYRRDVSPLSENTNRRITRQKVHGRVFEIIGNQRVPMPNVLVFDQSHHRTLTDAEGRFELMAHSNELPEEDRKRGARYGVVLTAKAHGYVVFKPMQLYTNLDETDEGLELYLARRDSHRIRIQFENPQVSSGPVTVVIARADYGERPGRPGTVADWDERRFIVANVDPIEGAWFAVPAERHVGFGLESPYLLRSVSAPGVLSDASSMPPASMSNEETVYNVKLYVEDTLTVAGTATDMRTGEPLPNARVYGPGFTEFTVADERGRFELVTAREPKGPEGKPVPEGERFLYVAHEGYAPIRTLIKDGTLSPTLTGGMAPEGGSLAGPWEFQLRPFVSASIDCTALDSAFLEDGGVSVPSEVREVMRFYGGGWKIPPGGICAAAFFPWGLNQMQANTGIPQPGLPRDPVKIPDHCWQGDEPYRLKLEH